MSPLFQKVQRVKYNGIGKNLSNYLKLSKTSCEQKFTIKTSFLVFYRESIVFSTELFSLSEKIFLKKY